MPFSTVSDGDIVATGFAAFIATNLAAAGVEYDGIPGAPAYTTATEWPIFIGPSVPPTPDRCIIVTPTTENRVRANVEQGVQVRFRGLDMGKNDPADAISQVRAAAQAVFDLCYPNGFPRVHVDLGTFRAGAILARGRGPIPDDDRHRPGAVENFVIRYRKPLPLDGPPTYVPITPPADEQTALEALAAHIADATPHPAYDDIPDLVTEYEDGP